MATTPFHKKPIEVEDPFFRDWVESGLAELVTYLAKYAAFDQWLKSHPQEETP